jgi:hypothetical protein
MLRLSRAVLEKPEQKGKFWVGAKFAFLLKERTKTFSKMGTRLLNIRERKNLLYF